MAGDSKVETAYHPKLRPHMTRKTTDLRNRGAGRGATLAGLALAGTAAVGASVAGGGLKFDVDKNPTHHESIKPQNLADVQAQSLPSEVNNGRLESDKIKGALSRIEVEKQEQVIRQNYLEKGDFERVSQYEQLIKQSAEGKAPVDLLIGLVIFESRGHADWVSDADAAGLTQMMPEIARSYGLIVGEDPELDERFNPELELEATVKYLVDAYKRWGDWSLAVWEYQIGAPELYNIIQKYLNSREIYLDPLALDLDEGQSIALREKYKETISQNGITAFKLLNDAQIAAEYTGEAWNWTDTYVKGVYAAAQVYYQMKQVR